MVRSVDVSSVHGEECAWSGVCMVRSVDVRSMELRRVEVRSVW